MGICAFGGRAAGGERDVPFFFPHYARPCAGLIILFVVYGMRFAGVTFRAGGVGRWYSGCYCWLIGVSTLCTTVAACFATWHIAATFTPGARCCNS